MRIRIYISLRRCHSSMSYWFFYWRVNTKHISQPVHWICCIVESLSDFVISIFLIFWLINSVECGFSNISSRLWRFCWVVRVNRWSMPWLPHWCGASRNCRFVIFGIKAFLLKNIISLCCSSDLGRFRRFLQIFDWKGSHHPRISAFIVIMAKRCCWLRYTRWAMWFVNRRLLHFMLIISTSSWTQTIMVSNTNWVKCNIRSSCRWITTLQLIKIMK